MLPEEMSTSHTENTVNDYNPETVATAAADKVSKLDINDFKVAISFFVAAAAGAAYVISRPRVQRALKELMTPEPQNATVNVAAEDYKDARDNAGPSKS